MPSINLESPLIIEEILLKRGYQIHYKDEYVCSVENRTNPRERPISIPQDVAKNNGVLSEDIIKQILMDAKIDPADYPALASEVKAELKRRS